MVEDTKRKYVLLDIDDFQKQKEKMVITTGDNYVGSAEPQLREKLATLYASIASQFAAPTNSQMQNFETVKDLYDTSLKELEQLNSKNRKKIEEHDEMLHEMQEEIKRLNHEVKLLQKQSNAQNQEELKSGCKLKAI